MGRGALKKRKRENNSQDPEIFGEKKAQEKKVLSASIKDISCVSLYFQPKILPLILM